MAIYGLHVHIYSHIFSYLPYETCYIFGGSPASASHEKRIWSWALLNNESWQIGPPFFAHHMIWYTYCIELIYIYILVSQCVYIYIHIAKICLLWLRLLYGFSLTIIWVINYYKYGVINIASTGNPKKNQTEAEESTILLSYGGKFTVTFPFLTSLCTGY